MAAPEGSTIVASIPLSNCANAGTDDKHNTAKSEKSKLRFQATNTGAPPKWVHLLQKLELLDFLKAFNFAASK
jgi:hypothetical protein